MTTNTTEQEITEYRAQLKLMIEVIDILHNGRMPTELVSTIIKRPLDAIQVLEKPAIN